MCCSQRHLIHNISLNFIAVTWIFLRHIVGAAARSGNFNEWNYVCLPIVGFRFSAQ